MRRILKIPLKNDYDPGNSSNFAAIVGLPRVSFLIVNSSALSLARGKLLADL